MATTRPLPRRVAAPAFMTTPARPPRPWPNLPAETQAQIAHVLAALLRRMPANSPAIEESPRADRLERSRRAAERGPPRPARLHLRAPVLGQSGPESSREHRAPVPPGRPCRRARLAARTGPRHRRGSRQVGRGERRAGRLPEAHRRDRARQRWPGRQPGCLPAGAQQPRLASAARAVLLVRGAHRRWRAALRSGRLPRPPAPGLVRHHERGGAASDPNAPPPRRAPESGAWRAALAPPGWTGP